MTGTIRGKHEDKLEHKLSATLRTPLNTATSPRMNSIPDQVGTTIGPGSASSRTSTSNSVPRQKGGTSLAPRGIPPERGFARGECGHGVGRSFARARRRLPPALIR